MRIIGGDGSVTNLLADTYPIDIIEIASTLATQNRYGGRSMPYTVAQHSVLVSRLVPERLAFQGLMHDAHEAITTDLPRPIKEYLEHTAPGAWHNFEHKAASIVRAHFRLPTSLDPLIKEADDRAFLIEIGKVFGLEARNAYYAQGHIPDYSYPLVPLSKADAFDAFIQRFSELGPNCL